MASGLGVVDFHLTDLHSSYYKQLLDIAALQGEGNLPRPHDHFSPHSPDLHDFSGQDRSLFLDLRDHQLTERPSASHLA